MDRRFCCGNVRFGLACSGIRVWGPFGSRRDRGSPLICNFSIRCCDIKPYGYPKELKTIGDHIRAKRLDLGVTQKLQAHKWGYVTDTIKNWEQNHTQPGSRQFPKIVKFLGYDPLPEPTNLIEKMTRFRWLQGWSQKELAYNMGVDPCTISSWERGEHCPTPESKAKIERYLRLRNFP